MSSAERDAALKALHEAEAALATFEQSESSTSADEPVVAPVAVAEATGADPVVTAPVAPVVAPEAPAKYLDLGPEYLGPVAINGT